MKVHTDHVLQEALALAPEERSMVALSLVDSLQGDDAPDDEITKSWVAEARKRSEDVRAGRSSAMALGDFRSWFKSL